MPWWGELLVGLVVLVGLIGVVVQVLPGSTVVLGAILVWAILTGGHVAWVVFAVAAVAIGAAIALKFVIAGRHMKGGGVPGSTMWWGGAAGVVGFFVIPVVGLFVGFVAGVYVAERIRVREPRDAWTATVRAIKATGISIVVELAGSLVATVAWIVGLVLT